MNKINVTRAACAGIAALFVIACGAGNTPDAAPTQTPGPTFVTTIDDTPEASPSTAPQPSVRQVPTITDGVWEVPGEVKPGTYRTTVPAESRNCYWERLRDFEDKIDSIIANDNVNPGTRTIVTIGKADRGFHAEGCGTWTKIK